MVVVIVVSIQSTVWKKGAATAKLHIPMYLFGLVEETGGQLPHLELERGITGDVHVHCTRFELEGKPVACFINKIGHLGANITCMSDPWQIQYVKHLGFIYAAFNFYFYQFQKPQH